MKELQNFIYIIHILCYDMYNNYIRRLVMKTKKSTAFILALLAVILQFTACSESGTEESSAGGARSEAENVMETETEADDPVPEITNYNGHDFRIASSEYTYFHDAEEVTGERLSDAIYERNLKVEDLYNITVTCSDYGFPDIQSVLVKNVQAGDDFADAVGYPITALVSDAYANKNYFYNLNDLDKIDLDMPWWDDAYTSAVSVNGYCPSLTGNAIITDDMCMNCIVFNSTMFKNHYPGESLYQLAIDGTWTIDKMQEYSAKATVDLDGNGKINFKDQIGFNSTSGSMILFIYGFGYDPLIFDGSNIPTPNTGEQLYAFYQRALELMKDKNVVMQEAMPRAYDGAFDGFMEDRAMFFETNMTQVYNRLREMESDYGVMPFPKFDENQKEYYTQVSIWAEALAIPGSVSDAERSADILTALAYYGDELHEVVNDDILSSKIAREEAFADAMKILMDSKFYSIDAMVNLTGISTILNDMSSSSGDMFYSKWERVNQSALANIEKFFSDTDE